jgi:hypothetical protein
VHLAIQMARCAVRELSSCQCNIAVLICHFFWGMLVTAIAGVFTVAAEVAGLTFRFSLVPVIDREGVLRQQRGVPAAGFMTIITGQSEKSKVDFWFSMTILTLRGRSLVKLVDMTALAFNFQVPPIQVEHSLVIERAHPIYAIMTLETGTPHLNLVLKYIDLVIERVASKAGIR